MLVDRRAGEVQLFAGGFPGGQHGAGRRLTATLTTAAMEASQFFFRCARTPVCRGRQSREGNGTRTVGAGSNSGCGGESDPDGEGGSLLLIEHVATDATAVTHPAAARTEAATKDRFVGGAALPAAMGGRGGTVLVAGAQPPVVGILVAAGLGGAGCAGGAWGRLLSGGGGLPRADPPACAWLAPVTLPLGRASDIE